MATYFITEEYAQNFRQNVRACFREDTHEHWSLFSNYITTSFVSQKHPFVIDIHYTKETKMFISTLVPNVLTFIILDYIPQVIVYWSCQRHGKYANNMITSLHFVDEDDVSITTYPVHFFPRYIFKEMEYDNKRTLLESIILRNEKSLDNT